jgi:hypothetical protein
MNPIYMKRYLYTALAFVAAAACSDFQQPHFKDVVELVPETTQVYVQKEGGDVYTKVYSNGAIVFEVYIKIFFVKAHKSPFMPEFFVYESQNTTAYQ